MSESCCECICPLCRPGDLSSTLQAAEMVPKPVTGSSMSRCQTDFHFYVCKQSHPINEGALQIDLTITCKNNTKPRAQPCSDSTDLFFISFKRGIFFKNSVPGLIISSLLFFLMDLSGELQPQLQRDLPSSLGQDAPCASLC